MPQAVGEYLKTLGSDSDEDYSDGERAKNRLVKLAKRKGVAEHINLSFRRERLNRKDDLALVYSFAEYLEKNEQIESAKEVLKSAIPQSRNNYYLEKAQYFLSNKNDFDGARSALGRLSETAENPRRAISYQLQIAEKFCGGKSAQ